ncbi:MULTISPECIES: holo-ACP synthase [unclassified Bacillus (in: firmicutes)]|uniref:holo-ACP synthase n=1 Tax=unclassified Bacillus (in: firmicutes) TaxID=185979 RepID=UPI0008F37853|nr:MULTISPECIES: holo-ACP synthase [unclassified Bacillus (in: firmicutes)]SFB24313.1 holo-[acyl-carrier protein] synthase [Bacillus sp. UNCCL13]SFQ91384.1 holo-[acyl-carrier-protein] synthase [Bacillus sp. cl95]
MITGIGIDIIELKRIEEMMNRQKKFSSRILTETEILEFEALSSRRKVEYLAGRFSAKEAYSKAIGTGIGQQLSFLDIEVSKDEKGKPYISKPKSKGVHLSISHSHEYAVAQVIIEG